MAKGRSSLYKHRGPLLVSILEENISHHPAGWVIVHINRRQSNIQPVALPRKIWQYHTSAGHAFSRKPSDWKKKQGKPMHLPPRLRPEHAIVPAFGSSPTNSGGLPSKRRTAYTPTTGEPEHKTNQSSSLFLTGEGGIFQTAAGGIWSQQRPTVPPDTP